MSDRVKGFVVALAEHIREEETEYISNALGMVKGVLSVAPIMATPDDWVVKERVESDIRKRPWDALKRG